MTNAEIIKELIASLEEAMDLAAVSLPNMNYQETIGKAKRLLAHEDTYQRALHQWGSAFQLEMMIEECSELTTALQKNKRGIASNVAEELADVEIMCEQLRLIFNPVLIDQEKEAKLIRLRGNTAALQA